ncbi:hypothetical protein [Stappia sp. TSB10P1A]|uniref:hypothetical protein n=1 Tax=Stappia sp. TSB10P1A TaxID=2003585 RepID=UPI001643F3E7|nr:hypothetical protein [Stappia sp. TSB10P1A]
MFFLATGVHPSYATNMTAGVVMEKMPARERAAFVMGIVEGLAYARFRKDTIAAGSKDERGMTCIYDWFYKDTAVSFARVDAVFRQHTGHFPSTLLAVMVKEACGE